MALTVPDLGLGASLSIGRSVGKSGAARVHRHRSVSRPLQRSQIIALGGESAPQVIIIQPLAPAPVASERTESVASKTYVPPRWVDGGYGVQLLEPGHWVEAKQATTR